MTDSAGSLPPVPSEGAIHLTAPTGSEDPLAGVPELHTYTAVTEEDRVEGLRLIADGVAQQRQFVSRQLIFHPAVVAVAIAILAVCAQFLYHGDLGDLLLVGTTWSGVIVAILLGIRFVTGPYLEFAEQTGTWRWLGKDSDMIITKFGDEYIGAAVVHITKSESNRCNAPSSTDTSSPTSKRQTKKSANSGRHPLRVLIRAWTVKRRYRHKGIGHDLLEAAIRLAKSKGVATDAYGSVDFADDYAGYERVIPDTKPLVYLRFNEALNRQESKARMMLEEVISETLNDRERRKWGKEKEKKT